MRTLDGSLSGIVCPAAATLVVQGLAQYYIQLAPPSSLFKGMEVFLGQKGRRHKGIVCGVTTWPVAKTLLLTSQLLPMWALLEPHRNQIKLIDSWLLKKNPFSGGMHAAYQDVLRRPVPA